VAAFVEVIEHEQGPNVPTQSCREHFRHLVRYIAGIYCDSQEVIACREGMKVVHINALHQIDTEGMNERECPASPVASENLALLVTP
jgi:hypothetical protein